MTKNMTSGTPAILLLLFAVPLIIGNIFQQFYSMADTMIVGRTLGVQALAAVGCTGSITFFILGFVMGYTSGLSIITAQRFGAQDEEGVRKSFAASIVLACALGITVSLFAPLIAGPLLTLLQTPAEIKESAELYLKIIFAGTFSSILFNLTSNTMRSLGDSRTPLYFLIGACIVNIFLDYFAILFLHMGVEGAACATVISQLLSGLCCCFYIAKKVPALKLSRRHFHLTLSDLYVHLRSAVPMGFQMSIIAIGSLILQSALNRLGAVSVAAYTSASKIDMLCTMPFNSMGSALATFSAQNYGARKIDRVKKGVFHSILITVSFSIVVGFVSVLFGKNLASIFVGKGETEVLNLAGIFLKINGSLYWILALLLLYRFTLQGLGNSLVPTIAGIMELFMRAFGGLVLAEKFGFPGACFSNPLAWIGACIPLGTAYYILIRRYSRQQQTTAES